MLLRQWHAGKKPHQSRLLTPMEDWQKVEQRKRREKGREENSWSIDFSKRSSRRWYSRHMKMSFQRTYSGCSSVVVSVPRWKTSIRVFLCVSMCMWGVSLP